MIKGVAEIELMDVNTGKKEKHVEKNMVTNALKKLFETPLFGKIPSFLLPVYQNAIGGVLIFDKTIEENPDIIVPPGDAECIGHAGASAYSGENERRGSLNASESMLIDNGFKLVWDFATNQGNGTIQCICLTSKWGGEKGFGHNNKITESDYLYKSVDSIFGATESRRTIFDENYQYEFMQDGNLLTITKYKRPALGVMLRSDYRNKRLEIKQQITLSYTKRMRYLNPKIMGDKIRITYIDANHANTLKITDISKENLSVIHEEDMVFQGIKGYDYPGNISVFSGDYVYIPGTKSIYKCNTKNTADIKEIPFPAGISSIMTMTGPVAGRILCEEFLIDGNDKTYYLKANESIYRHINELYATNEPYPDSPNNIYLNLFTPYLATINNLASPVVKTADKTMKITYTVTEE